MITKKHLEVTSIYIVGVIIIIFGLYMFFTKTSFGIISNSFYVMAGGLVISGVGSAYGRKKLMNPRFRKQIEDEIKRKAEEKKRRKREKEESRKKAERNKEKGRPKEAEETGLQKGKVIKVLVCPFCGEENKYTAKFCDECGKRLRPR